MVLTKNATLLAVMAAVMPAAAQAECLGSGCYSGLGTFLFGLAVAALALVLAFAGVAHATVASEIAFPNLNAWGRPVLLDAGSSP